MLYVLLFLVTIIAPIIFWFWFFISHDRAEPEPKKLLFKVFLFGVVAAFLALIVNLAVILAVLPEQSSNILRGEGLQPTDGFSITVLLILFFLAAPLEEFLKYFVLRKYTYRKYEFNQIADGVFYGVTLALGFSFIENIFYFYRLMEEPIMIFSATVLVRGIATMLLHITTTGFIGYGLGKMKFTAGQSSFIILKFLVLAILLHGIFNVLLLIPNGIILAFPLLFSAFIYLLFLLKKPETKLVWKLADSSSSGGDSKEDQPLASA